MGMEQVLEKLRFGVFEFVLAPGKTIVFPPFKGNVFRGALGKALKDLTCVFHSKDCKECLIRDKCLYAQLFESHNTGGKSILKKVEKAPHPFVIFVPDKYQLEYPENYKIRFYLTLIGSALEYISYFILAFEQIGKKGIGKNRSPFKVEWEGICQNDTFTELIPHSVGLRLRKPLRGNPTRLRVWFLNFPEGINIL